jgi:hypothetical protein
MCATITKTTLSLTNRHLSPGIFHGCRIAVCSEDTYIIACERELFLIQTHLKPPNTFKKDNKKYILNFESFNASIISIPQAEPAHRTEIQNLFLTENRNVKAQSAEQSPLLYSIDQMGLCNVYWVNNLEVKPAWTLYPSSPTKPLELGWAGVTASRLNPEKVY